MSDFERVKSIFFEACALPVGERAAFVRLATSESPQLYEPIMDLLAHDADPLPFIEGAAAGSAAALLAHALTLDTPAPRAHLAACGDPPTSISGYRILRVIGEGGMGVVYEAEQQDPRRRVALKVIRPHNATPTLLRRFQQEIHVLAQLRHPGIAQVYHAGSETRDGVETPFFAMELIDGVPLQAYVREAAPRPAEILRVVAEVCDALQHAHAKGVIHRDLKPANILVERPCGKTQDGGPHPRIVDFGVARATDPELLVRSLHTSAGQLIGTVTYMSPEQASGDPQRIDARSDVYSLGVITYELLTGRLPYDVAGKLLHESTRIIREEEATRLGSVDRALRGDVEIIVGKALEKEPARRYASAAEMADDIRRHLAHQPIVARPASAVYQLRKFARRNRALAGTITLTFLVLLAATSISLWQRQVARTAEYQSARQRRIADERADALADAAWRSYCSGLDAAVASLKYGDPVTAASWIESAGDHPERWEWRHLRSRLDQRFAWVDTGEALLAWNCAADLVGVLAVSSTGTVRTWKPGDESPTEGRPLEAPPLVRAALSADGSRLAGIIDATTGEVGVWCTATGAPVANVRTHTAASVLAISPAGQRVAIGGDGGFLWHTARPDAPEVITGRIFEALAFSGDGQRLAGGYKLPGAGTAYLLDYDACSGVHMRKKACPQTSARIRSLSLNPSGTTALVGLDDHSARLFGFDTGGLIRELKGHTAPVTGTAWDSTDRRVATVSGDGTARVWNARTGDPLRVFFIPGAKFDSVAFSRDGKSLVAHAERTLHVWDLESQEPGLTVLRGHASYVYGVAFIGDSPRLVSGSWDADLRVWDSGTGELLRVIPTGTERVLAVASTPASALVATAHERGLIKLWDAETGAPIADLTSGTTGRVTALVLAGSGRRLFARTQTGVYAWDTSAKAQTWSYPLNGREFGAMACSPDERLLAVDGPGLRISVLDAAIGKERAQCVGHARPVNALAFSTDGTVLASGSNDAAIRLWNPETGAPQATLVGHRENVYALAFSPDGRRLASGSLDSTIRLWAMETKDEVLALEGHEDYVFALAFSPDGSILASGSGDHTIRLWDTHSRFERRLAMLRDQPAPGP